MVELTLSNPYIDNLFHSLADPIRRDILRRLIDTEQSVTQIAAIYKISLAAVSKHIKVLEHARLVTKRRRGKEQLVKIEAQAITDAANILHAYEQRMNARFDLLEQLLEGGKSNG